MAICLSTHTSLERQKDTYFAYIVKTFLFLSLALFVAHWAKSSCPEPLPAYSFLPKQCLSSRSPLESSLFLSPNITWSAKYQEKERQKSWNLPCATQFHILSGIQILGSFLMNSHSTLGGRANRNSGHANPKARLLPTVPLGIIL